MTIVGIECNGAAFLTPFQEGQHQKLLFQGFFLTFDMIESQNHTIRSGENIFTHKFCKYDGKLYYSRYC